VDAKHLNVQPHIYSGQKNEIGNKEFCIVRGRLEHWPMEQNTVCREFLTTQEANAGY